MMCQICQQHVLHIETTKDGERIITERKLITGEQVKPCLAWNENARTKEIVMELHRLIENRSALDALQKKHEQEVQALREQTLSRVGELKKELIAIRDGHAV